MTAAALVDYVCEHAECDRQTVWPDKAAELGWFVIADRYGKTRVICPGHNNTGRTK